MHHSSPFCHIHSHCSQCLHSTVNHHLTADCIPHHPSRLPASTTVPCHSLWRSAQSQPAGKAKQEPHSLPSSSSARRTMHCTGPTHTCFLFHPLSLPLAYLRGGVSRRASTTTAAAAAAAGAPGTFSPPTCLLSGLRTDKATTREGGREGGHLFARKMRSLNRNQSALQIIIELTICSLALTSPPSLHVHVRNYLSAYIPLSIYLPAL